MQDFSRVWPARSRCHANVSSEISEFLNVGWHILAGLGRPVWSADVEGLSW